MEEESIRKKLLEMLGEKPGSTKNELYYGYFENQGLKFPKMYTSLRSLIEEGKVKIDGKKKNTGHYLADAEIPDNVPKASSQPKSKESGATHPFRKGQKIKGRFVVEKDEGAQDGSSCWKYSYDSNVKEVSVEFLENVSKLVPLTFRVRDQETNEIIDERVPKWKQEREAKLQSADAEATTAGS